MKSQIQIRVLGCIQRSGFYKIPRTTSLGLAIKKAGGFAKDPYPPSGNISIRSKRIRDGEYYQRQRINYKNNLNALGILLRDGDLITIQYDVRGPLVPIPTGIYIIKKILKN
ncbi:MAG: hypothetical protein KF722_06530 [Nitrospira sp.]|nr:hypothetical protein [Nitrospira sp.]